MERYSIYDQSTWAMLLRCWLLCHLGKSHNFWKLLNFLVEKVSAEWMVLTILGSWLAWFVHLSLSLGQIKWNFYLSETPRGLSFANISSHFVSSSTPTASPIQMASNFLSFSWTSFLSSKPTLFSTGNFYLEISQVSSSSLCSIPNSSFPPALCFFSLIPHIFFECILYESIGLGTGNAMVNNIVPFFTMITD